MNYLTEGVDLINCALREIGIDGLDGSSGHDHVDADGAAAHALIAIALLLVPIAEYATEQKLTRPGVLDDLDEVD